MDMLEIYGGNNLTGAVDISGSKNAALPILIACLLNGQPNRLQNIPRLRDTLFLAELLRSFGVDIEAQKNNQIFIDTKQITNNRAEYNMVRKMRASVLTLAPLLVRTGAAQVSLPGGCAIGSRPVDIHLKGLEALGAQIEVTQGYIHARLKNNTFVGNHFKLDLPSVGATEQFILAAVCANGESVFTNVAKEPEIVELCNVLNRAGAKISGHGTNRLCIQGVSNLSGIDHVIGFDRIEAGTFIAIAAVTKSSLVLKNINLDSIESVLERFRFAGVQFEYCANSQSLWVKPPECLRPADIETAAYPGFPTDMQAQFLATMIFAHGESTIYERIFENRMMHVPELRRLGAKIEVYNSKARVIGPKKLQGAPVMATDLRASASLVIAALAANGRSEIRRVYHLDRGYENLVEKLQMLGAKIKRIAQ